MREPALLPPPALGIREVDAWSRAEKGDDDDRIRLADLVGCVGLREHADEPERRTTAIRAMAYCGDFTALAYLASIGSAARDDDGMSALQSVAFAAAQPRRSTDPEDADDLAEGCAVLLKLARSSAARPRRVLAIGALRMLSERGCVKPSDLPTDLDAK